MNNSFGNQDMQDMIPSFTIASGGRIPCVGLGTFGSDSVAPAVVADTVTNAVRAGYRHIQQPALFEFCRRHNIQPIAYCPLGSPGRPERDRTPEDTVDLEDRAIRSIAARLKMTPAQVAIRWAIQRGQLPIPLSVNHFFENLEAATKPPLSLKDMDDIAKADRDCRLIKGQVFLWKEHQTREDLWDPDGTIAR